MRAFDASTIKKQFPLLLREVNGLPLVYLDSANTTQKPQTVIDTMTTFMEQSYAPINRSAYHLAAAATDAYEGAREKVQRFINARRAHEVIFTKNATEALNLVVYSWGRANLHKGDVVVLTHMEHHANIVPWLMLQQERGIVLRWVPLTADGQLDLTNLPELLAGAKVFGFTAMSNVMGTITPVQQLCAAAHAAGALAIVDACQYVPHNLTDVQAWGADFIAFSELPAKFEAGTPPITEAVGLGAAVDFLNELGMDNVRQHEIEVASYAIRTLRERFGDDITLHGPTNVEVRGATFSLEFRGIHPHDLSQVLDQRNVCVRAGHHCAKPLMRELGVNATARASFYLYNDTSDVDTLADALDSASDIFGS